MIPRTYNILVCVLALFPYGISHLLITMHVAALWLEKTVLSIRNEVRLKTLPSVCHLEPLVSWPLFVPTHWRMETRCACTFRRPTMEPFPLGGMPTFSGSMESMHFLLTNRMAKVESPSLSGALLKMSWKQKDRLPSWVRRVLNRSATIIAEATTDEAVATTKKSQSKHSRYSSCLSTF